MDIADIELVIRIADPKSDKERLFRLEAEVDDLKDSDSQS
jgi:hypothetical protein